MATNKKGDDMGLSWTGSVNLSTGTATTSNLAKVFIPHKPMNEPGVDAEQLKVWHDVPEELNRALRDGMKKISTNCLKENAEIVLNLFQEIILKHVLSLQIQDNQLGKLLRGKRRQENDLGTTSDTMVLAGKVAKSSLLGRDPWGDEELPETAPAATGVRLPLQVPNATVPARPGVSGSPAIDPAAP